MCVVVVVVVERDILTLSRETTTSFFLLADLFGRGDYGFVVFFSGASEGEVGEGGAEFGGDVDGFGFCWDRGRGAVGCAVCGSGGGETLCLGFVEGQAGFGGGAFFGFGRAADDAHFAWCLNSSERCEIEVREGW